ncbi:MAG: NAD-dependent epimerase/dehydratase family protein [Candidatus Hodarchaeales archaeon]|jgi:UDP-glucose 4-epimerase
MQKPNIGKNIIITGSSGNLGKLIVNNIPNYNLICIDVRNPDYKLPLNANFVNYDITRNNFDDLLSKLNPSTIIHTAFTVTPVKQNQRKKALVNDMIGTKNVLKGAKSANANHVIYLSSTLAYGALIKNNHLLKETDSLQAKEDIHYSYHKKIVEEKICLPYMKKHSKPILTILRASGILGPHIENYVTEILNWKVLPFISEGKSTKIQWLHEFDFIQAILRAIETEKKGVFNITPNTSESFIEQSKYLPKRSIFIPDKLSRLVSKFMFHFNISKAPSAYLDFVRYQFIASNKKAKKELNWNPKYSTKEALLSIYK